MVPRFSRGELLRQRSTEITPHLPVYSVLAAGSLQRLPGWIMALENSIASDGSPSVDLQDFSNALASSSTKRRLAALSRIEKNLADRCR